MKQYVVGVLFFLVLIPTAFAGNVDALITESKTLIEAQRYDEALERLHQAHMQQPRNDDILLLIARVHGWQKNYDTAERELMAILARHPGYKDAADALAWVKRARVAPDSFKWQMDAGLEVSSFSRSQQPNWNQQFIQISRFLGDTTVHGRVERYDQFTNIDSAYEIGADYRFSPRLNGYLLTSVSPDSDFRPRWRIAGGGGLRLDPESIHFVPSWFTLDIRHDDYDSVAVRNINPGLRIEPAEDWAISPRMISVKQLGTDTVYGWSVRLDGRFAPGWRFNVGYADAPETVAAVTVNTTTFFGGMSIDIDDAHILHLSYTHDDRENSYIRHVFDASLSYRF